MTESPGNIFWGGDEEGLDRDELFALVRHLDETIARGLPIQQELEHQALKLRLLKRLNGLIREQITRMEKHKGKGAP